LGFRIINIWLWLRLPKAFYSGCSTYDRCANRHNFRSDLKNSVQPLLFFCFLVLCVVF